MARKHCSLGGLATLLMVGCALDGNPTDAHTAPLSITPGGAGISFGIASANARDPMPLQVGPNVVTSSPQIPLAFNFGPTPVGTIQQVTWSLTNIGDEATGPLDLSSTNNIQFSASIATCEPLEPQATCNVTITYAPGDSLEAHTATFSVVGFPGSAYVFSGSGRPPFSAENP